MAADDGMRPPSPPVGWVMHYHTHHERPCWLHTTSRVVSWTPPYEMRHLDDAEVHAPPSDAAPQSVFVEAIAAKQVEAWDAIRKEQHSSISMPASRAEAMTYEQVLERDLATCPSHTCKEFVARRACQHDVRGCRQSSNFHVPVSFVNEYAAAVLGARVHYEVDTAPCNDPRGPWVQPPHRGCIRILGILRGVDFK